jgi:uncharacterized protein YprB with RNaseH-like and TPR domain
MGGPAPVGIPAEQPAAGASAGAEPVLAPFAVTFDARECGRECGTDLGAAWEVRPPLADLLPDHAARAAQLAVHGGADVLVLDIETAGLAAAPLFLVGLLTVGPEGLELAQFLARDYTEEPVVLQAFGERAAARPRWITFNGASFDLPYLADRCAYHRLPAPVPRDHVDLLPLARRHWRGSTRDCRLQTLERAICGQHRLGDVPGQAIPELYHEFVRQGNWEIVAPILHHNALDLLTQAQLWTELRR